MIEKINGTAFKDMVLFGAACIAGQKQAINDLNVFPVPDGDTGTNMYLTIQTACAELNKSQPATIDDAAKITARGLLRGARGNSGVILSLLFRGMSKSLKGLTEADGAALAAAMQEGVATAYGAVMKPAEGTVLTVSRLAAQQCEGLTEKQIIVIPTATVPQGITAMMSFDPDENDPQTIAQAMVAAAQTVSTAQITYAARNSDFDGFAINEGDYLALLDGKLFGTSRSMDELLDKLSQHAAQAGAEYINIYTGEGVSEAEGAKTEALFAQCCPDAEVAAIPGGQSVYFYIISIE